MKNIMKLFTLAAAAVSISAKAVPVINENVASGGVIVIYPDHADAHRFYIAPNVVEISTNEGGVPNFSYVETSSGLFGTTLGIMQMTLAPTYTRDELDKAKAKIVAKDAQAVFSALPFLESKLVLTGRLPQLISDNQCNHKAGLVGQMQSCSLVLTKRGREIWYDALAQKKLFTTLQFEYSVDAMVRTANGGLADEVSRIGIATVISGEQLAKYPQLISKRQPLPLDNSNEIMLNVDSAAKDLE